MNELAIQYDLAAITRAPTLGERTKVKYVAEVRKYLATGASITDRHALINYATSLKQSSRAFFKAALRCITTEFEQDLKANALETPDFEQTQRAIMALEAIRDAVKVKKQEGTKSHTWLTQAQVKQITSLCTDRRDWLILALLLGAGLRREELAALKYEDVKQQPMKNGEMRTVLQVLGKGEKFRTIPISKLLAERIGQGEGRIIDVSSHRVYQIVRRYGRKIGKPELQPHDCRRSFATLAYNAGVPLVQISVLLGHANVSVTQRYLSLELDLESTASDFIQLSSGA